MTSPSELIWKRPYTSYEHPVMEVARPLRALHSDYLESDGFRKAKEAIKAMNRQYAVTEMVSIILETASYQIPNKIGKSELQKYESPIKRRVEDGTLFFAALAIVYRRLPTGKGFPAPDPVDIILHNTFDWSMSPHNALYFLDAANEADIENMRRQLRMDRMAEIHGHPRLLTDDDRGVIMTDIKTRKLKRMNIRSKAKALQAESSE